MIHDLVRRVISIFGAVAPDDGDAVVEALRAELTRLTPFDEGELALTLVADVHRRPLTPHGEALLADDVLGHLGEQRGCLRIDDVRHADGQPRTCERLAQRQLRSLLAIPIVLGGHTRGAIALAARRPCAFSGAPSPPLVCLASAAGLALTQALKLSGLSDEHEHLRQERDRLVRALAEGQQAVLDARCESEARAAERDATQRALDTLNRNHETLLDTRQLPLVVKPETQIPPADGADETATDPATQTPRETEDAPARPTAQAGDTAQPRSELRAKPIPVQPGAPIPKAPMAEIREPASANQSQPTSPQPRPADGPARANAHGHRRRRH